MSDKQERIEFYLSEISKAEAYLSQGIKEVNGIDLQEHIEDCRDIIKGIEEDG